jgi:hypothetical protein
MNYATSSAATAPVATAHTVPAAVTLATALSSTVQHAQ